MQPAENAAYTIHQRSLYTSGPPAAAVEGSCLFDCVRRGGVITNPNHPSCTTRATAARTETRSKAIALQLCERASFLLIWTINGSQAQASGKEEGGAWSVDDFPEVRSSDFVGFDVAPPHE